MARRRAAACGLLLALCAACLAVRVAGTGALEPLVFSQEFLYRKIGAEMLRLPDNLKAVMNGTLRRAPTTPPKEVKVNCLNTVAPEPLNWKMWCPQTHANVTDWVDDVGTTHRRIVMQPMPTMTTKMAVWFMTPMFPTHLTVGGKRLGKNYLWHPLDHVGELDFKLAPGKSLLAPPTLMTHLHENYRLPAGKPPKPYATDLWVGAHDLALNLPRHRYVLGFEVMGFQAFTLLVEFTDTPAGLVISVEVLLGTAASGYDPKNPLFGTERHVAMLVNAMLFEAVMKPYRLNGEFTAALNAVTRHVVEEFGNLPEFVPQAWAASVPGKVLAQLDKWQADMIAATSPLLSSQAGVAGGAA